MVDVKYEDGVDSPSPLAGSVDGDVELFVSLDLAVAPGFLVVVVGLAGVLLSRLFAALIVRSQNRSWHFRFGAATERGTVWVVRLIGAAAIAMGTAMIVESIP